MTAMPNVAPALRDRLIVALDVPTAEEAEALVRSLGESVSFYKIGLQLQFAPDGSGLRLADRLIQQGKRLFLDAKLFDIPETAERATENIARLGATFLTVHSAGRTVEAAVRGRGSSLLQILAVTVLTSMDAADLAGPEMGEVNVKDVVRHRAAHALASGADGVIASGEEAALIRELAGTRLKIVTPGVRRASDATHDQKRIVTPAGAIRAGADHLVVGRPITRAPEPRRVAEEICQEIAGALPGGGTA